MRRVRSASRRWLAPVLTLLLLATSAALLPDGPAATPAAAAVTLPRGFREQTVFAGLVQPTSIAFARDGRVFVAEKRGVIKVFASADARHPTVFADLRGRVHNYWDRGLLSIALHPDFPRKPWVYVLYTRDGEIGGRVPRYGGRGDVDPCPEGTTKGCVASGRLSRLTARGNRWTGAEKPLVTDWCQQFPSHSVGALRFGPDKALYVSAGDGGSFNWVDYGQHGEPNNGCGDPPSGRPWGPQVPPDAEGGALHAQDVRSSGDPTTLSGTVARVDPTTGRAPRTNPMAASGDANTRRIIAFGLRQPFRFAFRPGTDELWIADVGWSGYEELDRTVAGDLGVDNFGWPCYEGPERQDGYDAADLRLCESLYPSGAVTQPWFSYAHGQDVVPGDDCDASAGSSVSGIAFYPGGNYPAAYDGALFFADYARRCVWYLPRGRDGQPARTPVLFAREAANPIDLEVSPNGELWYIDVNGTVRRFTYRPGNQPPNAVAIADPTNGEPPLRVTFDARHSSDPDPGDHLTYAWDLDGDGAFDDGTAPVVTWTYTQPGQRHPRLRVGDGREHADTAVTVDVGRTAPVPEITGPAPGATFAVGDTVTFAGGATDPQTGPVPASALRWSADIYHCPRPGGCHRHPGLFQVDGRGGGSFVMPDHEYASHVELRLTARSAGETSTAARRIDFKQVDLAMASDPPGIDLTLNGEKATAPFTRPAYVNGAVSVAAPATATVAGAAYRFAGWTDGGMRIHDLTVPPGPATLIARYRQVAPDPGSALYADDFDDGDSAGWNPVVGNWAVCRPPGVSGSYCAAAGPDNVALVGPTRWRDYAVEADVTMTGDDGGAMLLAGVQDSGGHWYQFQLKRDAAGNRAWWLQRRDGTSWTVLAVGPLDYHAGVTYRLRLTLARGLLVSAISDDGGTTFHPLGAVRDATYAGGAVGLRAWGGSVVFDNVRVAAR